MLAILVKALLTFSRYAAGKASALVIDIGHYNTSVTAMWEGMVLRKSEFLVRPMHCF